MKFKLKEIQCPECGTMNVLSLRNLSGAITIFCKNCGAEIHLVLSRTLLDMELRHPLARDKSKQKNDKPSKSSFL